MVGHNALDFEVYQSLIDASLDSPDLLADLWSDECLLRFGFDASDREKRSEVDSTLSTLPSLPTLHRSHSPSLSLSLSPDQCSSESSDSSESQPKCPQVIPSMNSVSKACQTAFPSVQTSTSAGDPNKKRGRGRPRIEDPEVKARHKQISQRKAAKKYRTKQKSIVVDGQQEIRLLERVNGWRRACVITLIDANEQLMKKCLQLDRISAQDFKRLEKVPQLLLECEKALK